MKPLRNHPLEPLVIKYLEQKKVHPKTIKAYKIAFKYYIKYLKDNRIKYPQTSDLILFKQHRMSLGLSETYLYIFISAIKGLYKYLKIQDESYDLGGYYVNDIAAAIKNVSVKPMLKKRVLTQDEAKRFILCMKEKRHYIHHYRDYAIIMLMLTSALSPYDIMHARKSNFKYRDQRILFINKKGEMRYAHKINLSPMTYEALRSYVLKRNDKNPYLFISHRQIGHTLHISRTFFRDMFRRILTSCGFDARMVTPHALRHSAALFYYESGASVMEVKDLLRHKKLSSTQMYEAYYQRLHSDAEAKIEALLFEDDVQ